MRGRERESVCVCVCVCVRVWVGTLDLQIAFSACLVGFCADSCMNLPVYTAQSDFTERHGLSLFGLYPRVFVLRVRKALELQIP